MLANAVLIELDFFMYLIAENGMEVKRSTVPRPSHAVEHFRDCLLVSS